MQRMRGAHVAHLENVDGLRRRGAKPDRHHEGLRRDAEGVGCTTAGWRGVHGARWAPCPLLPRRRSNRGHGGGGDGWRDNTTTRAAR